MNILVTGSHGFIGKNLVDHLKNLQDVNILEFNRGDSEEFLFGQIKSSDLVIHLAGVNRPKDQVDFQSSNSELTEKICAHIALSNKRIPIIFSSSIHAHEDTEYGKSKADAENALIKFHEQTSNPVRILRLPGVFGKYCKPNYNSVVATFCHNIANNLPIDVINPDKNILLIYVDDLINSIINLITENNDGFEYITIDPAYKIQINDLAEILYAFRDSKNSLLTGDIGSGFLKALYATYLSYLNVEQFSYPLISHNDKRGSFVEVIKNQNFGQISYLIAKPGMTRGGHYHHTKCEKFIVVQGQAKFRFVHSITEAHHEIIVSGDQPSIVQTIPGWAHDITNIGTDDLIALIWSNEVFDPSRPDTIRFDFHNE